MLLFSGSIAWGRCAADQNEDTLRPGRTCAICHGDDMTTEKIYCLDADELADICEGLAEIERGEVAFDEEVQATFDDLRRASDRTVPS